MTHSCPAILPMPVITPAPGASSLYMPYAASCDSSRNGVPGSSNWAMRSRGSSLPRDTCLSREACPPPNAIFATFSFRSATSNSSAAAFARNSSLRGFSFDSMIGIGLSARSSCFSEQFAADQHAANFTGSCTDLIQLRVAPQTAHRILVDIAITTQDLDRFSGHPRRFFCRIKNHARAIFPDLAAMTGAKRIELTSHRVEIRAARLQGRIKIGDLALNQLEFADRLTELLAVVDVRHDRVHARDHDARRATREHRTFIVEATHQHLHAAVQCPKDIFLGHFNVLEHEFAGMRAAHAELVELLRDGKPLHALLDDKRRNALRIGLDIRLRIHHERVAIRPVGDR